MAVRWLEREVEKMAVKKLVEESRLGSWLDKFIESQLPETLILIPNYELP